tara:strand:- start:4939 stop:5454 length:516 start_codon:yes stop_codon:yes gene_type:complete
MSLRAYKSNNATFYQIMTVSVQQSNWYGFDETFTIQKDYVNFRVDFSYTASPGTSYFKNLQLIQLVKAEVQDSEMNWAGRRTSYYEGTKITSTDYNVDSPDTVDGGPVIVVNTVSSTTPSSNPIGSSTLTDRAQRSAINRVVDNILPGTAERAAGGKQAVNRSLDSPSSNM